MVASLTGKRALVTGATSGIGRGIAQALAAAGAAVVVHGRDAVRAEETARRLRVDGAEAEVLLADLGDVAAVADLAERVIATGPVDILVNNAGIFDFWDVLEPDVTSADRMWATNVVAPMVLSSRLGSAMTGRGGAIVNISTAGTVSPRVVPGSAVYTATKAALNVLTRHLAAQLGPHGVRVNGVAPGPVLTEGIDAMGATPEVSAMGEGSPARRAAVPSDIARAVAWLAGSEAGYLHGELVTVDGGWAVS